jgi:hypothetical protein
MAGILKVDTIQNANADNIITQTNSTTLTIGASGDTVTLAAGATSSGFGATYNGAVNWSTTVQTTGFTAVTGTGYFCNTTAGAFTVTLPATPSAGAIVAFKDYAKTWDTNNLTIGRNSSNIEGVAANAVQSTEGQSITLIYVDSTKGWIVIDTGLASDAQVPQYITATGGTITTCGDYKIHTFTGSGCFVVSNSGNAAGSNTLDYLVVAGGGGANISYAGGGAGGFRYSNSTFPVTSSPAAPLANATGITASITTYPITVGSGGVGGPGPTMSPGNPSVFSTITSTGGGRGGNTPTPVAPPAMNGGSGGGGHTGQCTSTSPGGLGNSPPVSPSQGNNGGTGQQQGGVGDVGGGGGGAMAVGSNGALPGAGGSGGIGAGIPTAFGSNGIPSGGYQYYAGGGGANSNSTPGSGGLGGGGNGLGPARAQTAGGTNTGGGGGGGPSAPLAGGGSGIVVIRYKYQ